MADFRVSQSKLEPLTLKSDILGFFCGHYYSHVKDRLHGEFQPVLPMSHPFGQSSVKN